MVLSMTGYGKTSTTYNDKKINIEFKSLNSKQLDLSCRIAPAYREHELKLRSMLSKKLVRGKVELNIFVEYPEAKPNLSINHELAKAYHQELTGLASAIGETNVNLFSHVLKMPEVMSSKTEELNDDEWDAVLDGINNSLQAFIEFRTQEGNVLQKDLISRVNSILTYLKDVEQYEAERIETVKKRITDNLAKIEAKVDESRLEQEMVYFIEKFDVTEEKVRLSAHCSYFTETMEKENGQGKKLGFITQEMGREINTLGSKANHTEIQKLVVKMKDELEKIKEQTLNIL